MENKKFTKKEALKEISDILIELDKQEEYEKGKAEKLTEIEKITYTLQNKIQLNKSEIIAKGTIEEGSNSESLACKLEDDKYALQKVESLFNMFRS